LLVDLALLERCVLGSVAIRVTVGKSDEMFSLVWDMLRDIGEETEYVEKLKVADRDASQITAGRRWETPAVAFLPTTYDRTRLRDANDPCK